MPRTITFQPGSELSDFIDELVDTGYYHNQSEVIRDGLRLLREKNARSALRQLRKLIDEGDASGAPVQWNADEFLSGMKKKKHGKKVQTSATGGKGSGKHL